MTTSEPSSEPTSDVPALDQDVPCPECDDNLRGLTVPRCAECGFQFEWSDSDVFKRPKPDWIERHPKQAASLALLFLVIAFLVPGLLSAPRQTIGILMLVVFLGSPIIGPTVQAVLEYLVLLPLLGLPSWKRVRAWWEGVLIGCALVHMTLYLCGWWLSWLDELQPWTSLARRWPLIVLVTLETFAVQWLVVSLRARRWELDIPAKRLILSCAVAKLAVAIMWLYSVRMLRAV